MHLKLKVLVFSFDLYILYEPKIVIVTYMKLKCTKTTNSKANFILENFSKTFMYKLI